MAPQFTLTNGPLLRALRVCSIWAATSLPVPDSPTSMTADSDGAILRSRSPTSSISGDSPMRRATDATAQRTAGTRATATLRSQPKVAMAKDPVPVPKPVIGTSAKVTSALSTSSLMADPSCSWLECSEPIVGDRQVGGCKAVH